MPSNREDDPKTLLQRQRANFLRDQRSEKQPPPSPRPTAPPRLPGGLETSLDSLRQPISSATDAYNPKSDK